MSAVETGEMSAVETEQIFTIATYYTYICPVSTADICLVSTADICLVSTDDQRADIKAWLAEAATAADKTKGRESLACGGRDSGQQKVYMVPWMTQVWQPNKIDTAI